MKGNTGIQYFLLLLIITGLGSCNTQEKIQIEEPPEVVAMQPVVVQGNTEYRETPAKAFNLIHTRLKVKPDWQNRQLKGEATIALRPYFYEQDTLVLDAKYFDIHSVFLIKAGQEKRLPYRYDSLQLHIGLDTTYTRHDTLEISIEYTAKPYEGATGGSRAIRSDRGLYFVNADGSDPDIPRQIWTQGETEASSRWFPTIDHPNQKTTQEIYITVDSSFTTLSNGLLQYSSLDSAGLRTDYWKQDQPHAPYLFMMTIGNFIRIRDFWRDSIEVDYYMEPAYAPYAQQIFGNTPEMMEFYSQLLDYDFPWSKYAQVVVREFVSGAMENTTAVIFFDRLNKNSRELLDQDYEEIIAHELIHHWFGDLVTCESWSNIPLNESFATYGEILWADYKYGQDEADYQRLQDLRRYFAEAVFKKKKLIRFDYDHREQMFDRHSYQKGGLILHMLREQVGDDAFFKSLNLYLKQREFNTAEYHDLRLAFEEVTGQDMNPFFNQWFRSAGHPELNITHRYNDSLQQQELIVEQLQDTSLYPVFYLPVSIAVHSDGKITEQKIEVKNMQDTFVFPMQIPPDLVVFDARDALLAQITEKKPLAQWYNQFFAGNRIKIRLSALHSYTREAQGTSAYSADSLKSLLNAALNDSFWYVRAAAIRSIRSSALRNFPNQFREKLLILAMDDSISHVRDEAVITLGQMEDTSVKGTLTNALHDSSYSVMSSALLALAKVDGALAFAKADSLREEKNKQVQSAVLKVISTFGDEKEWQWFSTRIQQTQRAEKILHLFWLEQLLERSSLSVVKEALPVYRRAAMEITDEDHKIYIVNILNRLIRHLQKQQETLETKSEKDTETGDGNEYSENIMELKLVINQANEIVDIVSKEISKN